MYQNQNVNFRVNHIVPDVIDHIEAFKETNQFVWMSIGDLHDIADGFALPVSTQVNIPLDKQKIADTDKTSAKQSYNEDKIFRYIEQAKRVDKWLKMLFDYIGENYNENEIVVSLFADHGQSYMVKPGKHFLDRARTQIAFMFRGGISDGIGIRSEIVSNCDYYEIMQRIVAGDISYKTKSGNLPMVFGGDEREYMIADSIHPNDNYHGAVYSKDGSFYFTNMYPIQTDGRFVLNEYEYWYENSSGEVVNDSEMEKKYLDIMLEHIAPILIY